MDSVDLSVVRGDTPEWSYKFFNLDGNPMNLTGCTIWLTVKPTIDSDNLDTSALLKHYIQIDGSGVVTESAGFTIGGVDPDPDSPTYGQVVSGVASGVVSHVLSQEESTGLELGTFVYDVAVRNAAGRYKTIIQNAPFTVTPDVTRRITVP